MIETIGVIASTVIPFFNIPLIVRMRQRKSSADISITWTAGVWACTLLMLPAGLVSTHLAFKCFTTVNFVLFTAVAWSVMRYRKKAV